MPRRACAQRSATAHLPLPAASTQPTGPGVPARSSSSSSSITASGGLARVPADGRCGVQGPDELEHRRQRLRQPTFDQACRGAARWRPRRSTARPPRRGTSTTASSVSWTMSIVSRCSSWSFVDATSAFAMRASTTGSPLRGAVPASGCDRTTSPDRETSSSGLAPIEPVDREHEARRERGGAVRARR